MKVPPLIRTRTELQEKMSLLEALGDIQAALSVLDQPIDINVHPADQHYLSLKCEISPVEKDSADYKVKSIFSNFLHKIGCMMAELSPPPITSSSVKVLSFHTTCTVFLSL